MNTRKFTFRFDFLFGAGAVSLLHSLIRRQNLLCPYLPFFLAAVALAAALAAAARVPFQATVVTFAVSLLLPMHATHTE